jgi:hypothetical protein
MIINYDDFQHVKFIFSQNFISLFWGLFIDETDLRVRYWLTRVMACFASIIFYLQRLKFLLKKHFTIVFEDCPVRSLKFFIWSAHSNEMKWTRSKLFSSAQFSFRAGQELFLRCPSIFLPEPGSLPQKVPTKI